MEPPGLHPVASPRQGGDFLEGGGLRMRLQATSTRPKPAPRRKIFLQQSQSRIFSLSLPCRSALSLPAAGRGRKVRATQSATQANDLMAVRSWERNRKQPPVKASGWG